MDKTLNSWRTNILKSVILCALAYMIVGGAALGVGYGLSGRHPLLIVGISDIAATAVVFFFSFLLNNSSVYDPYWSVAPIPIALYFTFRVSPGRIDAVRLSVVLVLVSELPGNTHDPDDRCFSGMPFALRFSFPRCE